MHSSPSDFLAIQPKILYFGTPVVLVSSRNEDGSANIAPMSSCWTIGWTAVLGLTLTGKTIENLRREGECVLNVPGPELWQAVERLAPLTGKNPVPPNKAEQFRFERDKFAASQLTPLCSEAVRPPRVLECPLQLEGYVRRIMQIGQEESGYPAGAASVEVRVVRVHARSDIVAGGRHIDPSRWQPLIYNFRHYFGLGHELGRTFRAEI